MEEQERLEERVTGLVWSPIPHPLIPPHAGLTCSPRFPSTGCCTLALRNPQGPVMVSLEACGCTEGPLGTGHLDKCVNRIPSLPCAPFESPITLPFSPGILQSLRLPRVYTCSRMASLASCRARFLSAAFFGLVIGKGRCLFLWQHDSPRESVYARWAGRGDPQKLNQGRGARNCLCTRS